MSKLIDIEIIKAEIERRIENAKEFSRKYFPEKCGASDEADTLEEILSFLNTLPEDVNKDSEEATDLYQI